MNILRKLIFLSFILHFSVQATEGMWLLPQIQEKEKFQALQKMGFILPVEQIYHEKNSSLKDAVVSFGGFCTGSFISDKGLILTNHHCGYAAIQQVSSVENNYLKNGFWAKDLNEEIPISGLFVRVLESMREVTSDMLKGVEHVKTETERQDLLKSNQNEILDRLKLDSNQKFAEIKSFYEGNQFYLFIFHQFNDVRLVAAPEEAIGKFGGETDNWMWPRHTGDFSFFRVYADEKNQPNVYKKNNKPYQPKKFFPLSLKPIAEQDFAMILGFPGTTFRYMTSFEVQEMANQILPTNVALRALKMEILRENMEKKSETRLKYAPMYARLANYWKNFTGKIQDIKRYQVAEKKLELEQKALEFINKNSEYAGYQNTLNNLKNIVLEQRNAQRLAQYYREILRDGIPLVELFNIFKPILNQKDKKLTDNEIDNLLKKTQQFYKNYEEKTALDLTEALLLKFVKDWDSTYYGENLNKILADTKKQIENKNGRSKILLPVDLSTLISTLTGQVFGKSIFLDAKKVEEMLKKQDFSILIQDPAYQILADFDQMNIANQKSEKDLELKKYKRDWLALLKLIHGNTLYADANSTLRLTYGRVEGYSPQEALEYRYYTTGQGILEKENPHQEEFKVSELLHNTLVKKDFGAYSVKDYLPINFLASLDITGGNSGSPILNGKGELIGCAFDGVWENMMGDLYVSDKVQRTIGVDNHYILFILDKIGNAQNLLKEIKIVK